MGLRMKIWNQVEGKFDRELELNYKDGDLEMFDGKISYIIIDRDKLDNDFSGPEFGGELCFSPKRKDLAFEPINSYVKVVKRTKIAEKMFGNRIWKENEEWLVVKK